MAHRMLLVLSTTTPATTAKALKLCRDEGWKTANWDDGEFPDASCQVVITENPEELGLWYRLAPVSFLGHCLAADSKGISPLYAAALGSAILHGPEVSGYRDIYASLAEAGATQIVNDADSLSTALAYLLAADQVALMAHAGWATMSEGAEVSNQIINLLQQVLDKAEAGNEGT